MACGASTATSATAFSGAGSNGSVLPFGRRHWVAWTGPADIEIGDDERPRHEATDWVDEQIRHPIDPERVPAWRLVMQPLTGGGAAVTLIASHTICDGLALSMAVADAANGITRDLGYPPRTHAPAGGRWWTMAAKCCGRYGDMGTSNSLFAGIAARMGQLMGRVDDRGLVKLAFPVSERTEGDTH